MLLRMTTSVSSAMSLMLAALVIWPAAGQARSAAPARVTAPSGFDLLPMKLPASGAVAASATAVSHTWLIGVDPGARARQLAVAAGARRVLDNAYVVPTSRARAAATVLKRAGVLKYTEPDVRLQR